jgi:hypothetical protein
MSATKFHTHTGQRAKFKDQDIIIIIIIIVKMDLQDVGWEAMAWIDLA